MFDDMVNIVGAEVMKDRHNNGAVGDGSYICHSPMSAVSADKRNAVVFLYSALAEKDMQFLNLLSHLGISECVLGLVISESFILPVLTERVLEHSNEIFVYHKNSF
jgi:hypothetical protein